LEEFPEVPADFFGAEDDVEGLMDEPQEPEASKPDIDGSEDNESDEYLAAVVDIPRGGDIITSTVTCRQRNANGQLIGKRNPNPLLDTRAYEVEFPDGTMDTYSANIIAENLFAQVDTEGRQYQDISEIIEHRKNGHAVSIDDAFISDKYGNQHRHKTTIGWALLVKLKGGSTSWVNWLISKIRTQLRWQNMP
jgi:hypothetical protein